MTSLSSPLLTLNRPPDDVPDLRRPEIDLTIASPAVHRGSFLLLKTWYIPTREPCLVILPAYRKLDAPNRAACIVTMSQAWRWSEELGDKMFVQHTLREFADPLGYSPHDIRRKNQVLGLIRDHLDDLVQMPPAGDLGKVVVADLFHHDIATGKTKHVEVKDHV